jgi:hypothetical protein
MSEMSYGDACLNNLEFIVGELKMKKFKNLNSMG